MGGSWVLLAGAWTGLGVALIVHWWTPVVPDLADVAARRAGVMSSDRVPPATGAVGARLADRLGLARYARDLALLDESSGTLAARKVGYGLLGLAFPPLLLAATALLGVGAPWSVPVALALLLGAVLFTVPDLDLRRRASRARADLREDLAVYLELVALERAADAGAGEALERAAAVGDSRFFLLAREELVRAQLAGVPAWRAFDALAGRVGVPELADVSDIVRLTGEDGAAVYSTLRARAASLRSALLSDAAAKANAASEHMVVPVALLGVAFLVLLGYPAFARIVYG